MVSKDRFRIGNSFVRKLSDPSQSLLDGSLQLYSLFPVWIHDCGVGTPSIVRLLSKCVDAVNITEW